MRVKVWANGTSESVSFSLLNTECREEKERINRLNDEHFQCYSTSMYSIIRLDSSAKKASKVMCEFEGSGFIMSFQKKGRTSCIVNQKKGSMHEKQNNIFFNNGLVRCRLTEADCFRIVLSESYVKVLSELYPKAMIPLANAHPKHGKPVFDYSHLNTTLEIEQTIKSIEDLYLLQQEGNEMVIEAKIRELLYMQIMQHAKVLNKKDLKIEKYKKQMQIARNFIECNMQELPSLHEIALAVGVCDTTLKIAFKYFYGKTVFGYINEYRLSKARELLFNPSYNISDVAFLSGYKHSSHFSAAFNQKYGITPNAYRNQYKEISTMKKVV